MGSNIIRKLDTGEELCLGCEKSHLLNALERIARERLEHRWHNPWDDPEGFHLDDFAAYGRLRL
jgi:hypothetical protein